MCIRNTCVTCKELDEEERFCNESEDKIVLSDKILLTEYCDKYTNKYL